MKFLAQWTEHVNERMRRPQLPLDTNAHLRDAMEWIHRAHDATKDGGIPHSYLIGKGWTPSSPEATACVIPTLFNWAETFRSVEAKRRALQMADWLLSVQLENGALPSVAGHPGAMDTAQGIFGWLSAHQETKQSTYLEAARRAGEWLIGSLAPDSTWHGPLGKGRAFHARIAWALVDLAQRCGDTRFAAPMPTFIAWVLEQQHEDGWFENNCTSNDAAPLLHTIAYTAQGLLETGLILGSPEFIAGTERVAHELVKYTGPDGRMPGRFSQGWQPAASWACLAGMAQIALVWQRLQQLEAIVVEEDVGLRFLAAANRVNAFLMRTQDRESRNKSLRGGLRGSYPVSGAHGRWRVSTMSTKFFVDALMKEIPGAQLPYRY